MKLETQNIRIDSAIIHKIAALVEKTKFSIEKANFNDKNARSLLIEYCFSSFKENAEFKFYHSSNLKLNEIYSYATSIFSNRSSFVPSSKSIADHLIECSNNSNIKEGELLIVLFDNCIIYDDKVVEALGIFKVESFSNFIQTHQKNTNYEIESEQGININKLDKGCLIFNTEKEDGYIVSVVDNTNKGIEAQYWIDDFLHVRQRQDKYFNTENTLTAYKEFITKKLPEEFDISKADQADMLNRSIQFFKEKDDFQLEEFSNEVLHYQEYIDGFNHYKKQYEQDRDIEIAENFTISNAAVKRQARNYKSVIKLDKNFHIYVHGDRTMIEQGEDKKGKFYKIYFREEN